MLETGRAVSTRPGAGRGGGEMNTHFTYLALGCGVQSSTIAEMIAEGELPVIRAAIFADTGDEPDYVYEQRDYLQVRLKCVGVPLVTTSAGDLVRNIREKQKFHTIPVFSMLAGRRTPSQLRRQCTREYKIAPNNRFIRADLYRRGLAIKYSNGAIHVNKGVTATTWLGISLDESQRMSATRVSWMGNEYPLIDKRMRRMDCIRYLKERNLPVPGKSACRVCPYHTDVYWREMRDSRPADWQHAIDFDAQLRDGTIRLPAQKKGDLYLHRSCVSLADVDLSTPQDHGQGDFFDVCDGGHCGI